MSLSPAPHGVALLGMVRPKDAGAERVFPTSCKFLRPSWAPSETSESTVEPQEQARDQWLGPSMETQRARRGPADTEMGRVALSPSRGGAGAQALE